MSRLVSMNARVAADAMASDEIEVVLVEIAHPELDAPIRLSTDPTERLSIDPLAYGTRSRWRNPAGGVFQFVLMSALVPGDQEDAPAEAALVVEAVTSGIAEALRSTTSPARVDMAVVLAASANLAEVEFLDLRLTSAEMDAGRIVLTIGRDAVEGESWPSGRMSRERFPGLHR